MKKPRIKQDDGREDLMLRCEYCGRKLIGMRRLRCPLCEAKIPDGGENV